MSDPQEPVVRVTLDTIYSKLLSLESLMAPVPAQVADHENRIRVVEAFKNKIIGIGVALSLGSGLAGAFISHVIK